MPTREERIERVHQTMTLRIKGLRRGQIIQAIKKQYDVSTRTAKRYLSEASNRLIREQTQDTELLRAEMDGMYRDVIAHADQKTRLCAMDSLAKLHGLITEKRTVQVSGEVGINSTIRQELLEDDEAREHCLAIANRLGGYGHNLASGNGDLGHKGN